MLSEEILTVSNGNNPITRLEQENKVVSNIARAMWHFCWYRWHRQSVAPVGITLSGNENVPVYFTISARYRGQWLRARGISVSYCSRELLQSYPSVSCSDRIIKAPLIRKRSRVDRETFSVDLGVYVDHRLPRRSSNEPRRARWKQEVKYARSFGGRSKMAPMGAFALFYQSGPWGTQRHRGKSGRRSSACYFAHETGRRLTCLKRIHANQQIRFIPRKKKAMNMQIVYFSVVELNGDAKYFVLPRIVSCVYVCAL